jgi:hypothetical protein
MKRAVRTTLRSASLAAICVAIFVLEIVGSCSFSFTGPWLVRYTPDRSELSREYFLVMNPARDTRPEAMAESVLRKLAVGDLVQIEALFGANRDLMSVEERRFPPVAWVLDDRNDSSDEIVLTYRVRRRGYRGFNEVLFTFVRQPALRLASVDAAY